MKVSYRWLSEIAPDLEGSPAELADRLAALGSPVEAIDSLGAGLEDVVVARVRSVRPHPNADRLRICEVEDGTEIRTVVCGAPNVEEGGIYPFAPVGASLPGGMTIGRAKIRGEVSEGMLCSERELGLGEGAAGLMVLDGRLTPGARLVEVLGLDDVRLHVEVTSNRPDLLSHEGIARELAPGGHRSLVLPLFPGEEPGRGGALAALDRIEGETIVTGGGLEIRIEAPERCTRYLGLVLRGVRIGASPDWLQRRLRAAGSRPINNVVDATNYLLLEGGQPLHAFDLHRLDGAQVVVRTVRAGEKLRTLDGIDRSLSPGMLAICDAQRPIAVAGVMGGADSEVRAETTDLLLECALFTPGPIRATRKALGLSTDASYRFERGVDPAGMERALLRAALLIQTIAGGTIEGPLLDVHPAPPRSRPLRLRPARVSALLGVELPTEEIRTLLEPLGFKLEEVPEGFEVEVPGFRSHDVRREVDLIEEVARRRGYDSFPETLGPFRPSSVPDHPLFALEDRLRSLLGATGLLEAQTPAFAPVGEGTVALLNPLSSEEGFLRERLLPGLIRRVEYNLARGNRDVRLFELGTVFQAGPPGELPLERTHLAIILHGGVAPRHWTGAASPLDLWEVKGMAARILGVALGEGATLAPGLPESGAPSGFEPTAAFTVLDSVGGVTGFAGRVAEDRADLPPWAGPLWAIEVALPREPLPAPTPQYRPLPTHPGVDRDLALLLPSGVEAAQVLKAVQASGGEALSEVRVFDLYRDETMPPGARSVAIRLHFLARDRTLTDREVEEGMTRVTETLARELHVGIRGSRG